MRQELSLVRRSARVSPPTVRDVVAVLFRQRGLVMVSFAAILVAVLVYGLIKPSYQARLKVLVRRGRVDPAMSPTPTPTVQFVRDDVTEEELNSEVELLHDDEILRTVVRSTGLDSAEGHWWGIFGKADDDVQLARAVRRLDQRLQAEPIRKTNLIAVTYASSSPAQAAKVLKALGSAYLERHLQLRRPSGEFAFFERQMWQSAHGLELAQLQLADFMSTQGVVSAALERDLALQKLSDMSAGETQIEMEMAEASARIHTLESKLPSLPERRTTQVRTSDNPLLLEKMKSRRLELDLKRTELLTKFKPSYRLVREVDQQIEETRASIVAEHEAPVLEQTTEQDPNHDWANAELVKAEVDLRALQGRAAASHTLLGYSRSTALRLGNDAIRQEGLLRNLKAAEEKYLLYVNKREEARIGDALDERGILNVAIAEQPIVPAIPMQSGWSFGVMGLLLAGTASVALGFAVDYLDPAFRTPDEVACYLGTPVLASLPRKSHGGHS